MGDYTLYDYPQRSNQWKELRHGRITASNFGYLYPNRFKTQEDLRDQILGLTTMETNAAMLHGIANEPKVREWYSNKYNVKVNEIGLAIPKWDPHIGVSVDGVYDNFSRIIEIKCPMRMYDPLFKRMNTPTPQLFRDPEYKHIWKSHYCQMQGGMKILGVPLCDYIVYAQKPYEMYYVETVEFDRDFWDNDLYPRIREFVKEYLDPKAY